MWGNQPPSLPVTPKSLFTIIEKPRWSEMLMLKWQDPSPLQQEPFDVIQKKHES